MMAGQPSLACDLRGIARLYGRTAALRATDLRLEGGACLALLGANGSGKTTLLKIVAGAIAPTLGGGTILGHDLVRDRKSLRLLVGYLSADSYLYEDLSADENVRFLLTMAGLKPRSAQIEGVLRRVGLDRVAGERVRTFSSGMRRRLSLARLIVLDPRLILLDEPYNSLDADGADLIDRLVRGWMEEGRAVILATHDADRALALADSVAVLQRGTLVYRGTPAGYRMRDAQHVG